MGLISLQLYSVREYAEKDFEGTLKKVRDAGFDGVEFAGFAGLSAKEMRDLLADVGLEPHSAHIGIDEFRHRMEETIVYAHTLGLKYAIIPGAAANTVEACYEINGILKEASKLFGRQGIRVGYHNHWHEFDKLDGRYALDIIMEDVDGICEVDTAWVKYAGVDPLTYIQSIGQQAGPIHVKDINDDYLTRKPEDVNVGVGEGVIDFPGIIAHLRNIGTLSRGLVIEQEAYVGDPFEALAKSVEALRRMGA